MDWEKWDLVEAMLVAEGISPILAVIPDNRDASLMVNNPLPEFWDRVRSWQARGWTIGLHGCHHLYVTRESGILGINSRSEFAGLPFDDQLKKINTGLEIFDREGVHATCWIAPSHSFDWTTVAALSKKGIHVISDGLAWMPYKERSESVWVPQQLGRLRAMPRGIWTFCYHINEMSINEVTEFGKSLKTHRSRIIKLDDALAVARDGRVPADSIIAFGRQMLTFLRCQREKVRAKPQIQDLSFENL